MAVANTLKKRGSRTDYGKHLQACRFPFVASKYPKSLASSPSSYGEVKDSTNRFSKAHGVWKRIFF